MYKLFLTLRYLRKRRIAYFAIGAVTLCVAMVLIVMSVMGGFLDKLKDKARGLLGDIIVDNSSINGFPLYDEFIREIEAWPEVVKATPVLYCYALLRFPETEQTDTVRVVGVRLKEVYEVNGFKPSLYYEKYYPGTTSLAEQQIPVMGFDPQSPKIALKEPDGTVFAEIHQPILPPAYQKAFEEARAAGVVDTETALSEREQALRAAGFPAFPGEHECVPEDEQPPTMIGDPRPGLIVGRDIVAERVPDGRYLRPRYYPRGCPVTLTLLPVSSRGTIDTPIRQPFRYTDDSRTGIYEIDSKHVYCDFTLLQGLLEMGPAERADESGTTAPGRCSQIQIKIRPGVDAQALAKRMEERYLAYLGNAPVDLDQTDRSLINRVSVKTWEQTQAHIIAPVEKERHLVTILFGIISIVAVVLVLCILYMIVLQKTRDIGIVKAIGGSSGGVAFIFIVYGAAVGIVGSALGSVLGVAFVRRINQIQEFLISLNPSWRVWDRTVYSFDEIPSTVRAEDVVTVICFAIIAATFGSLAAAWRAGSMQPVEAIRYE